uniref:Ovule protein n=1 Tax=Meloidogyne hapla TaxID=6305 RepID=A0A1I8B2M4_MELHA
MAEDTSLTSSNVRIENKQKQSLQHSPRPPTTFKTAALLASAVTTPTAAPAIASFVPFVGNSKRESSSPEHEFSRAINRRAFFLFEVVYLKNCSKNIQINSIKHPKHPPKH